MHLGGQEITVDGGSGRVYYGRLPLRGVDEDEDPAVRTLIEWAQMKSPLTVMPLSAVEALGALDIGTLDGDLDRRLRGTGSAFGAALESDEGVARAIKAGVSAVCVRHRLPALLAALSGRRS
jgi:pyruvate, orthophosphate dikinase